MLSCCFRRTVSIAVFASSTTVIACERSKVVAHIDTASVVSGRSVVERGATPSVYNWNELAGPVLLVQGGSLQEAIVLFPVGGDSAIAADILALQDSRAKVTLYGRGGQQLTAKLGISPAMTVVECRVWPLADIRSDAPGVAWAIGFVGGQTAALPLDSVEVLTPRDSMALVAEASRLASSVTSSTVASFQGLRFTVHDIRRFEASPGVQGMVAHTIRKVNQEASPQEEQTLLIAERDSGVSNGPYHLVYADRANGLEEELTIPEVIAGVRIGGRPTLIVARDSDEGVFYLMLERVGRNQWKVRWTSAMTRCG